MNYPRLGLAFLGASTAYLASSFVLLVIIPGMTIPFLTYPPVYLAQEDRRRVMPNNMIFILICILTATILFARFAPTRERQRNGLFFGAALGILAAIIYAFQNHHFNVALTVPLFECLTYTIQWFTVGVAISSVYKPM